MKKIIILAITLILILSSLGLFVLTQKASFFFNPVEAEIIISKGSSIKELSLQLKEKNIQIRFQLWIFLAYLQKEEILKFA